jgi:hypothetical protein
LRLCEKAFSTSTPTHDKFGDPVPLRKLAFAALIFAWFCYFTAGSLAVRFSDDDMMNIANYWRMRPAGFAASHFLLWRNFYRPMGGVFYLPLFHFFGFNPAPYHLAILGVLLVNVYLVYRLAILLRAGELAAALAALAASYHAVLGNLTYNISFVYDVLCGCFYLAALVYYVRIREAGRIPRAREVAVLVALFLCALNSKEMAATLPLILLAYEGFFQTRRSWRGAIATALLDLPYFYGKALGRGALAADPSYRLEFSASRILDFQTRSFAELLGRPPVIGGAAVLAIWLVLVYLAFRQPRPVLRFCCVFVAVTPLPVEFLPGRGGACLYLPWIGLAIFLAVVCVDFAHTAAAFMARERLFARLDLPSRFALVIAACVALWGCQNRELKRTYALTDMERTGATTADVIRQMQQLAPRTPPNSTVVFLNDPFEHFDMAFIAELWFRDRTVKVRLNRQTPLSAEEIARADRVFDFRDGRLIAVR